MRLLQARHHPAHHQAGVVRLVGDRGFALDDDGLVDDMDRKITWRLAVGDANAEQPSDHVAHDRSVKLRPHGVDRFLGEHIVQRLPDESLRCAAQPFVAAVGGAGDHPRIA